ncbi:MAG: alpha/beta fold hydrolase [Jatrophihabitans endophyticus]|nr:alpha/beta fold hydrolase [Jatrophihabitans endophyticus]
MSDSPLADRDGIGAWPGHEVTLGNGRTVHVRTTPAGPDAEPALFVHGLGGSAHNWTDFAGLLRDRLAIDAIDLPGHGRSGPPPHGRYSLDDFASTVVAYLETTGRGPVHLVGNSMGGAVSILVARRRPDLVRTLTLISPAVPDNRPRIYPLRNDPRVALLVVPVLGEWAVRRFNTRVAVEARAMGTIKLCFADRHRYPQARFDEAVAEARYRADLPWGESSVLRSMRALVRSQFLRGRAAWSAMRAITAPTLVLWGDTDRLVAPDLAPFVAAAVPDSRLLVLEDIGHTAMMEDPETSARALLALIEDSDT